MSVYDNKVRQVLILWDREPTTEQVDKLKQVAANVQVRTRESVELDTLEQTEVLFCSMSGLPPCISCVRDQMPQLRLIQTVSSGVNLIIDNPAFRGSRIPICNASGLHVLTIPPYIISTVLMIYLRLHHQYLNAQTKSKWIDQMPSADGTPYHAKTIFGKTVGLLGYGHLARETARLFSSLGAKVIAANSSGKRTEDVGYRIEATGDQYASIPQRIFNTSIDEEFEQFLSQSDVLVATLPSTSKTRWLLESRHFDLLPRQAVFVNVGRGDLVRSDILLQALNKPYDQGNGPLLGLVADVTEPEPLPDGHPLFTHPSTIITPHLSGNSLDEYDIATDICYQNILRLNRSERLLNIVDVTKGY